MQHVGHRASDEINRLHMEVARLREVSSDLLAEWDVLHSHYRLPISETTIARIEAARAVLGKSVISDKSIEREAEAAREKDRIRLMSTKFPTLED